MTEDALRGIQEVSAELGVTPRTLRFYEDQGLIEPTRVGTTRIYTKREVARMHLILRGKRLGFSIREIREFLDLYGSDPTHIDQVRHLRSRVQEHLEDLRKQQDALKETMAELRAIDREAEDWLANAAREERKIDAA